jgi:hypothetical protein
MQFVYCGKAWIGKEINMIRTTKSHRQCLPSNPEPTLCDVILLELFKRRSVRWAGHFVGKPGGRRPLGRHRRRCTVNIRMYLKWMGGRGVLILTHDRDRCRAFVHAVMHLRIP